jgi:hypothetical protein
MYITDRNRHPNRMVLENSLLVVGDIDEKTLDVVIRIPDIRTKIQFSVTGADEIKKMLARFEVGKVVLLEHDMGQEEGYYVTLTPTSVSLVGSTLTVEATAKEHGCDGRGVSYGDTPDEWRYCGNRDCEICEGRKSADDDYPD